MRKLLDSQAESSRTPSLIKVSRTRVIAATGLFAALSVILTSASQALGLNFPIIPYLQFDFGEVAIILAFLLFGPIPAAASAFVEFLTLMVLGQNVPIGPIFKIMSILSSLAGLYAGMVLAGKTSAKPNRALLLGSGLIVGLIARVGIMTIPNYYLLATVFTIPGSVGFLSPFFKLVGITMTDSNGLALILLFTAIFNVLQLVLVFAISYLLVRLPQLKQSLRSNRVAWFESLGKRNGSQK